MAVNLDPVRIRVLPGCETCGKPAEFSVYVLENKTVLREGFVCSSHLPQVISKVAQDD